jgi:hypothetical protein
MSRAIYFFLMLLLANWLFQWKLADWKIKKIQQSAEQIEKKIQEVSSELDLVIQHYLKDPEQWQRVKSRLK